MLPGEPSGDAGVAAELESIASRLAGLATETDHDVIGTELASIRAQLRLLAESNAEVGAWLEQRLGPALGGDEQPLQ